MKNIVVFTSGSGSNFQAVIDGILSGEIEGKIVGLIASKEGIYSIQRAALNGIPHRVITDQRELIDTCKAWKVDLIVLAGYLSILGAEFIKSFEHRIINIHPSLIPSFCGKGYYGMKVHQAAIAKGVRLSGATTHFVDEGTDTGPIIMQKCVEVDFDDTPEELQKKVLCVEHEILVQSVALYCRDRLRIVNGKVNIERI